MNHQFNDKTEHNLWYINTMRPIFIKKALYADTTANYLNPPEPAPFSEVTVSFRTAIDNVDEVSLVVQDEVHPMTVTSSNKWFDLYSCTITLSDKEIP